MNRFRMRSVFGSRIRGGVVVLAVLGMALSGCGTSSEDLVELGGDLPVTTSPAGSGDSEAAAGLPQDETFTVGEHFWHSGFRVDLIGGEITSTEDQLSKRVSITLTLSATLENLGADTGYLDPSIAVVTATNSYPLSFSSDVPTVLGGLKGQATLSFPIDETFDLATAELLVGDNGDNQARVALNGGGEAIRLEPTEIAMTGTLSMQLLDLAFTGAELRYDIPDRHRQVEAGKRALTLHFDAQSRKGGNWNLFATDLALVLPDGTAIAPDAIEIGSLPGSDTGVTTQGLSAQFLVDEMADGAYTLRLTPGSWFVGDDGVTEAVFDFTIP